MSNSATLSDQESTSSQAGLNEVRVEGLAGLSAASDDQPGQLSPREDESVAIPVLANEGQDSSSQGEVGSLDQTADITLYLNLKKKRKH